MQRKVKVFIASSLDGYIAREDGDVGWLFSDADYGYSQFFASIGVVLMGRKTYDKLLEFGIEYPYRGKKSYVLTRNAKRATGGLLPGPRCRQAANDNLPLSKGDRAADTPLG